MRCDGLKRQMLYVLMSICFILTLIHHVVLGVKRVVTLPKSVFRLFLLSIRSCLLIIFLCGKNVFALTLFHVFLSGAGQHEHTIGAHVLPSPLLSTDMSTYVRPTILMALALRKSRLVINGIGSQQKVF